MPLSLIVPIANTMAAVVDSNVVGALLFYLYMVAAILLTGLIALDLLRAYRQLQHATLVGRGQSRNSTILVLMGLAVLSFCSLSYHMLDFLIQSYRSWALSHIVVSRRDQPVRYATPKDWADMMALRVWNWSVESNLFQDFGEAICNGPQRFWWTELALLYSYGWNLYT